MLMSALIVIVALVVAAYLALSRRVAASESWQATVTPLASIMGSGFLVSAPLLGGAVGNYALFCMAGLLIVAYAVGAAIRFNIGVFEPVESDPGVAQRIAWVSRVVLTGAYFVSVSYYLQLLASFVLNMIGDVDPTTAHVVTTCLLVLICGVGMWRGLELLEGMEKYAVASNLGMIAALLVALVAYNGQLLVAGEWKVSPVPSEIDLQDFRVLLGLLIVVQGFETSRYLGDAHSAEMRVSTMRRAQLISAAIYLAFIAGCTTLFRSDFGTDVTAIVKMTAPIAVVLPVLLSLAAIGSQFSAAVADVEGAGGLIEDLSRRRLALRWTYLPIVLTTVGLTWVTDVNEIISYASRAFAVYYALQCVVAAIMAWPRGSRLRSLAFGGLAFVCSAVAIFGLPAE